MIVDVISRLKLGLARRFPRVKQAPNDLKPTEGLIFRDDERDRSLREHELYYWSSTPAPWY